MFFDTIRRPAAWFGLSAAIALCAPIGSASAATHAGPTPLTITPTFAANVGSAATGPAETVGAFEVAQNPRAQRRRVRRRTANRVRRRQAVRPQHRIYRNGRWYYYRNGRYYDNTGALLAAGAIGLAAGAVAGAALANSSRTTIVVDDGIPAPYTAEWYRRCDLKYRSFRASDGTFLGYDGVRRVCRLP